MLGKRAPTPRDQLQPQFEPADLQAQAGPQAQALGAAAAWVEGAAAWQPHWHA